MPPLRGRGALHAAGLALRLTHDYSAACKVTKSWKGDRDGHCSVCPPAQRPAPGGWRCASSRIQDKGLREEYPRTVRLAPAAAFPRLGYDSRPDEEERSRTLAGLYLGVGVFSWHPSPAFSLRLSCFRSRAFEADCSLLGPPSRLTPLHSRITAVLVEPGTVRDMPW